MVSVPGSMELSPGDRVLLGLPEAPLLGAAARLYLFPLISFFAGALLGAGLAEQWNWPSADLAAAGGGILAAMIHFRRLQRSLASQVAACRPVILRRL